MRRHLPKLPSAGPFSQLPRFRHGKGRRYVPDVVERVRVLVEGTTRSEAAIAAHVGIGVATVHGWKVRRGWTRPADASRSTRKVGIDRAGFSRRVREALARVEALTTREAERLQRQEPPDTAALGRRDAGRHRPASSPPGPSRPGAGTMSWDRPPVRLSLRPLGGQGQPYEDDVVALARELVEGTTLTQKQIAIRIGVSQMSVGRWTRAGRWRRPFGAARPRDEMGQSWSALERYGTRTTPWRRLEEAERLLDALEQEGGDRLDGVGRALRLLVEARATANRAVRRL